jgi:hypothetical protein
MHWGVWRNSDTQQACMRILQCRRRVEDSESLQSQYGVQYPYFVLRNVQLFAPPLKTESVGTEYIQNNGSKGSRSNEEHPLPLSLGVWVSLVSAVPSPQPTAHSHCHHAA